MKAVIFDMFETLVSLFHGRTYFSEDIAKDLGIPEEEFRTAWHATEYARTIGQYTMEEGVSLSLKAIGRYSEEAVRLVVEKRLAALTDTFQSIPEETFALLTELRQRGLYVGLISNCFSDECALMQASPLFQYFDTTKLSYEQGIAKPEQTIFFRAIDELGIEPEDCLYVGDGGSGELEAANAIGMKAVQAQWFRKGFYEPHVPCPVKTEFAQAQHWQDVLKYL